MEVPAMATKTAAGIFRALSAATLICCILAPVNVGGQASTAPSSQQAPLPEFYGIYAVDQGKVGSLFGGRAAGSFQTRHIDLFSFKTGTSTDATAFVFSPKVRFLVFDQQSGVVANTLHLYILPYGRNLRLGNPDLQIMGGGKSQIHQLNKPVSARVEVFRVQLASRPVSGQLQMVEVVPQGDLPDGVYLFYAQTEKGFQREFEYVRFVVGSLDGRQPSNCIDISFNFGGFGGVIEKNDYYMSHGPVEILEITREHYSLCEHSSPGSGTPPDSGSAPGATPPTTSVSCPDYDSCLETSVTSFRARRWDESLEYSQEASRLAPERGEPWLMIASAHFEKGMYNESWAELDRALALGATIQATVCRERFAGCSERATFRISSQEVSLVDRWDKTVFAVPPSGITSQGAQLYYRKTAAWLQLRVSGKKYNFYYIPEAVECTYEFVPECPEPGFTQQKVFANYVHHAIQAISSGTLPKPEPPPAPTPALHPVVPGGTIGQFQHGTLVTKLPSGSLVAAPTPQDATHTHAGVDIVADCGSPIYALADGAVFDLIVSEQDSDHQSLGYAVIVKHTAGSAAQDTYSAYFHMNEPPHVRQGDQVVGGQTQLAVVGKTGVATGCHLHLEVRHFDSRFLQDPQWNQPWNIYGLGNKTSSPLFLEKWENPEHVAAQLSRQLM